VEVREQDAKGRVHRVAGNDSGLTEAGREAQAQMARRQLMNRSPQVLVSPPLTMQLSPFAAMYCNAQGCRKYKRDVRRAPLVSPIGHSQCGRTLWYALTDCFKCFAKTCSKHTCKGEL